MQINTMNESQMMILESFAGAQDEQELNAMMDVLRNFYASRLEANPTMESFQTRETRQDDNGKEN